MALLRYAALSEVDPPLRQILWVNLAGQILLNAVVGERCRSDARNGGIVLGSGGPVRDWEWTRDGDDMIDTLKLEVVDRQ
jgi:hypothetical protein